MSNYRPDEDSFTESSTPSPRSRPSRYRLSPYTSDGQIPNSSPPTSSGHASGASNRRHPALSDPINAHWGSGDNNDWQPSTPSYPPRHSADPQWDLHGRPLDVARSRQPSDYGSPLPTNVHWNQASEYAETQQPPPLPQVNNQQQRSTLATISRTAGQIQSYYAPSPPCAAARVLVPAGAVGVVQEVISETQPVAAVRQVPFTTTAQPPVTTIQAMATQAPAVYETAHTVTLDQLRIIKERRSGEGSQTEQGLSASHNDESALPMHKIERKTSIRRSLSRAGRKVSQGLLDALRLGIEPAVVFRADAILYEWSMFLFFFIKRHTEIGEAFDPFQDQIEDAFDAKYHELLGEGKFLINEETESSTETPVELPVQEVTPVPTEDAETWIAHRKAKEAATAVRDHHTCSARRRLPAVKLAVQPLMPRTYPAGLPPSAPVPQFVEDPSEVDERSTPNPEGRTQSFHAEIVVKDETLSPSANERQSRLPRPSSNGSGRSTSHQRPSRGASAAQPVEEPTSQTPSKARKDSAQSVSPTKPAVRYRAQSRDEERYPNVRNIKK